MKANRKNREIRVPRVRVIGAEGEQVGILSPRRSAGHGQDVGLDLVEIQPNGDPPVCRIMDFGKFKFEQQKKAHAARKKTKQVEIKELKFRPTTEVGDYDDQAAQPATVSRRRRQGQESRSAFKRARDGPQELGEAMVKRSGRYRRRSGDRKFPALRRSPDGDDDRAEEKDLIFPSPAGGRGPGVRIGMMRKNTLIRPDGLLLPQAGEVKHRGSTASAAQTS